MTRGRLTAGRSRRCDGGFRVLRRIGQKKPRSGAGLKPTRGVREEETERMLRRHD